MATRLTGLSTFDASLKNSAKGMKFGVVVSEYNSEITGKLMEGCHAALIECGALEKNIKVIHVPGAFELPMGAQMLAASGKFDAIICLGCVIKGETKHDEYINHAVATGITELSLKLEKPVIFGVLTPDNLRQAKDRSGGRHGNKGIEAAITAVKMAALQRSLK